MATIFVSPGVFTKEQDFSVFASRIGITRLGLVGKTLKGPAFEAIKITSADEYALRFGGTHPNFPLSYVANSFLGQANDLTVSRVLGKGGFINSPAWLITSDASSTYTGSEETSGSTFSKTDATGPTTYSVTFTELVGGAPYASAATPVGDTIVVNYSAQTMSEIYAALVTGADANWASLGITMTDGDNTSDIIDGVVSISTVENATSKYSGSTLVVLRSKKSGNTAYFDEETDVQIGAITGNALGDFMISGSTGPLTDVTNSGYTVSLDETKQNYIGRIFGKNPKFIVGAPNLYIETIYPHFIREATARGEMSSLSSSLVFKNMSADDAYSNYESDYQNSSTPYIVSRVVGGEVHNLFKFNTISDGDFSAEEIKISIANIDPLNYTFDVYIRRFEDTDATASQTALERYSNVTLDDTQSNFIGKAIGTTNEEYPTRSRFVTVELALRYPENTVPGGFRGYTFRGDATASTGKAADLYYKTTYLSGDTVFKTYLGISELAYTSLTVSQTSSRTAVKTLEKDLFKYYGGQTTGTTTVKGFHLESGADTTAFVVGAHASLTGYTKAVSPLITDKTQLKFTLVPTGGFDGFDKYKSYDNTYEEFISDNIASFKEAIDVFANPEETDINLLATPGIDFSNNDELIKYALDAVEERADTLYIMDSPRVTTETAKGTPEEIINLLESTGIDTNYAATYWPWIQIEDTLSGKYTYQPPTLLVVKALALTDNVAAPWFAPAGLNRGIAGASIKRTDVKLTKANRDTLYGGRVNPIASFVQQGIVIWGQKTLQLRQSALDRINIRRLLLQVRRLISAASLTLLFEQNDQTLRNQFLAKVEPILLQIQNQRGLTAFKVVMDDSNNTAETIDRNMLVGKIQLKPTRTAEFIDLTFQVLPTGASFEDF